ncbi:putative polyamine transporter [Citrus sinensis]|uniref:Polyamine transporter n=1 Tax=Citrus sinensis TaxID=2711 RepID=A0ACB8KHB9_CITSI|nr:putative polyamine transporter [Citrus sinensis]
MGQSDAVEYVNINDQPSSPRVHGAKKVSILPLIFLIFYEVSGGPFGVEDSVKAAGPLLALLGFLVFPIIWSVPEALITAEMGTVFPENCGFVVWVSSALGPYWGFQQVWMKWLSGVIDNALYPVLFLDYLKSGIPALGDGLPRAFAALALTFVLTFMNYRGLTIVGWAAVLLGIFSFLPFVVMGLVSLPKLEPSRWLVVNLGEVDWNLYLNTLFWNLQLLGLNKYTSWRVGTGAIPLDRDLWTDGYFSDIAKVLGGVWLRWCIQGAAAMSNMGMFVAEMSSDSFQLLGMAERGMLPEFFAKRSCYGTPLIGIIFSASVLSVGAVVIGLVRQPCLKYAEKKRLMKFSTSAELSDLHGREQESVDSLPEFFYSKASGPSHWAFEFGQHALFKLIILHFYLTRQYNPTRKLAEDCCKYGAENQSDNSCVARAALQFGTSHDLMENERETLLGILRDQVSEPLRALINGAPLEDARHLTHRYDKLRHEVEAQAAEVFRHQSKIRESDISAESAVKLRNAEVRLTELKSTIMALGREATAAMLSVESQQQQMTYQRVYAMVIHPFDAQANGELSLSIDDYVVVRQVAPTGWSDGECKGQAGWFPSAYVERQEKAPASKISEANSPECDATS